MSSKITTDSTFTANPCQEWPSEIHLQIDEQHGRIWTTAFSIAEERGRGSHQNVPELWVFQWGRFLNFVLFFWLSINAGGKIPGLIVSAQDLTSCLWYYLAEQPRLDFLVVTIHILAALQLAFTDYKAHMHFANGFVFLFPKVKLIKVIAAMSFDLFFTSPIDFHKVLCSWKWSWS